MPTLLERSSFSCGKGWQSVVSYFTIPTTSFIKAAVNALSLFTLCGWSTHDITNYLNKDDPELNRSIISAQIIGLLAATAIILPFKFKQMKLKANKSGISESTPLLDEPTNTNQKMSCFDGLFLTLLLITSFTDLTLKARAVMQLPISSPFTIAINIIGGIGLTWQNIRFSFNSINNTPESFTNKYKAMKGSKYEILIECIGTLYRYASFWGAFFDLKNAPSALMTIIKATLYVPLGMLLQFANNQTTKPRDQQLSFCKHQLSALLVTPFYSIPDSALYIGGLFSMLELNINTKEQAQEEQTATLAMIAVFALLHIASYQPKAANVAAYFQPNKTGATVLPTVQTSTGEQNGTRRETTFVGNR